MTDDTGLGPIPIQLTADQIKVLAAHEQLKNALNAIEYPKSGRWEDRNTAILVLDAFAEYVSATFDVEGSNHILMSMHTEVLQDVVLHFRQGRWGAVDRRLALEAEGDAGAAHDDALMQFKKDALRNVEIASLQLKREGVVRYKAEARSKVSRLYKEIGLTFQRSKVKPSEDVTPELLESWEKRWDKDQRPRGK